MFPEDCSRTIFEKHFIVKYPASKKQDENYRHFRSVVYKHDGTLVCMSPAKSIPYEDFKKQFTIEQCIVEDFVEGTMINVFFDEGWHIATKSNVGAMCTFESNITFAGMFHDCMNYHQLTYDALDTKTSYSFVMQHPDHRIVTLVKPTLVCVAIFHGLEERLADIYPPKRYTFSSWEEAKQAAQNGLCKGLVFKRNGLRSKIRNMMHHSIESLKQNVPFPQRYIKLRNKPILKEYLFYFPEDRVKIETIETKIQEKTTRLYHTYRDCFMFKKEKARDHPMKSALYDLHTIYLQELYPRALTKKRVEEYIKNNWKE